MEAPAEPRMFCHRYQMTRTAETTLCRELRRLGKPAQRIQHQNPLQGTTSCDCGPCEYLLLLQQSCSSGQTPRQNQHLEAGPAQLRAPPSASKPTSLLLSSALHYQPSPPSFQRPFGSFCNYSHFLDKKKIPAIKMTDGTRSRSWQSPAGASPVSSPTPQLSKRDDWDAAPPNHRQTNRICHWIHR